MITVYSKPNCPHCDQAKAYLTANRIKFEVIDVTQDPAALAFIKDRGHRSVPQLYLGDELLVEGGNATLQRMHPDAVRALISGDAV